MIIRVGISNSPDRFRPLFLSFINISLHCLLGKVMHMWRSAIYVSLRGIRITRQPAFIVLQDHLALDLINESP